MDYKQKYLKYKAKYLKLKGGDPPEETDFENQAKFIKIGGGKQGTIYNLYGTNFAYKVFIGLTSTPKGAWSVRPKFSRFIGGQNYYGGFSIEQFKKSADNYKKASYLDLGPHFYKSYTFEKNIVEHGVILKHGVIVMDCIHGDTIKKLKDDDKINDRHHLRHPEIPRLPKKFTPEIQRRFDDLCNELNKNNLIITHEDHDDNFMVDRETGRVYGIDF